MNSGAISRSPKLFITPFLFTIAEGMADSDPLIDNVYSAGNLCIVIGWGSELSMIMRNL